ncbi:regulator of G-protein signaling 21-like isoform X2 [Heptranchias perlo]|uniref:regulator of G-protein signaling 21-like isoform X2 n=1 Tax=Heptranchias perlo TaxID=212740 RepID=UPI003559596A
MQTVLFLFPQLNLLAPKEEPYYRITKQDNQGEKRENKNSTSLDEPLQWGESLDKLLGHKSGLSLFRAFLQSEYSEENIEFWMACEDYKKTKSLAKLASKAKKIYSYFIETDAPKEVNIDFHTKEVTKKNVLQPTLSCFDLAQRKVHLLMEKDSYPRFLKSQLYRDLLKQTQVENNGHRRRSHSFTSAGLLQTQADFTAWL